METANTLNLDALYVEWCEDCASSAPTPLTEWIDRYPAYQAELVEWASDAPFVQMATSLLLDREAEERAVEIGMRVVMEMRAKIAPMPSLLDRAKSLGMNAGTLAQRLGVTASIVTSLHRRLFQFATVPQELVRRSAEALQVTPELLRSYLQQSPALAQGASYSSDTVPQVMEQADFADAIRQSALSEEEKAFWLNAE
jgi:hypothetical protein